MITDRRKFTTKITISGFLVFISIVRINSKSFPWPDVADVDCTLCRQFNKRTFIIIIIIIVHSVQGTSRNFLRSPTRVDNKADNADITQSQAANHHQLSSHVTLGLVECRLCTDSQAL